MASNRHLGRIVALQSLYEYDFRSEETLDIDDIVARNLRQYEGVIGDSDFVYSLAHAVLDNQQTLDEYIQPAAPEWPVEQIARVDKIILRMSVSELMFKQDTPPKVVINEAVELGKRFGSDNSSKFVNGVLGTVYREHIGTEQETAESTEAPEG